MLIPELPDPKARQNLESFLKSIDTIDLNDISVKRIFELKNEAFTTMPVKITGFIHSISDPKPLQIDKSRHSYVEMSIKDKADDQIKVLPIYDMEMQKRLKEAFQKQRMCTFFGTSLSIITDSDSYYVFYLADFKPKVTTLDLIEIQYDLKTNRADRFIKEIAIQKDNRFQYFKNQLINGLNIKGIDTARELSLALDFMIYQSFHPGCRTTIQ